MPPEAVVSRGPTRSTAQHCNGPPGPTHTFAKRFRLSEQGANPAAAYAAPDGLRSYRPICQTLLTESPPAAIKRVGATRTRPQSVPTLITCYCAIRRHCLRIIPSLVGFPWISPARCSRAAQVLGMCIIDYEPRRNAYGSVLLRTAPSKDAVTGLSYPSTPSFLGCQLRQVSPCSPAVLPRPQKPSCAVPVALFRYAPGVGLGPTFTR